MDISIIIPTYNEEVLIKETLEETIKFLNENFSTYEVIIADDGSMDATGMIVRDFIKKNPNVFFSGADRNRGKGCAVRRGFLKAQGEYILFMDADLSTPVDEILNLMAVMKEKNADIGVGSRALVDSKLVKPQKNLRMLMGKIFNLLLQLVLMRGIKDTQCGFKCFRKDVSRLVLSKAVIDGFCFDAELLFISRKFGFSIVQLPIRWINREDSRVNVIRGSVSMFLDLFRIRLNSFCGKYK